MTRALEKLGGKVEMRIGVAKDGPVVTDQGNMVLDVTFNGIDNPAEIESTYQQHSWRVGEWLL